jgi:tRNA 2-thiouridine synthesizing protein A
MPPPSAEAEAVIVDARGMRCPWPVLRAARAMRREARIVLIADDPVAQRDVPDLARANGWACTMEDQAGTTRYALSRQTGVVAD